jgi:hypothetical protein
MKKSILLLVVLITLSLWANGQLFKHGTKAYKRIAETWNIANYVQFKEDYPNSKFNSEIVRRMNCMQRNNAYPELISAQDTLRILNHLNLFDTCLYCSTYLPQPALKWLGKGKDDLSNLHARLDSLRCQYYWDESVMKSGPDNFSIIADFIRKYPFSHLELRARDSLQTRKERVFWQEAITTNNAVGFKMYLDSLPFGLHADEANVLYNDILFGEQLLRLESHNELVQGLRLLKMQKRYSPFTEQVIEKIKKIEDSDYQACLKRKSLKDWLAFESEYSGGYYFSEADKKIRTLSNLKAGESRSQYGTFLEMKNNKPDPIKFEFSQSNKKPITFLIKVGQTETCIIPSGSYKMRIINAETGDEILSETMNLIGQLIKLSCCSSIPN